MFHWTIFCGLIVYCYSSIILITACWALYTYWLIPWWIVFMMFLVSFCAIVLIPLCWGVFYWNFKDSNEDEPKVIAHLPIYIEPPSGKVCSAQPNAQSAVHFHIEKTDKQLNDSNGEK